MFRNERISRILQKGKAYINGQWIAADGGGIIAITNPANGATIGSIPNMGTAETHSAIEAANRAWPAWRAKTAGERSAILRKWFELMMVNQEDLAILMTLVQGKPLSESRDEIAYSASFLKRFSEEAWCIFGATTPAHAPDKRIVVIKEPIGVVAAITPWNFPSAMITRKAGPALAAECPVVLKPAGNTPFSALALAELGELAGVPAGVFNVITGSACLIGTELTSNPTWRAPSLPSSGTRARHACARTGTSCRTGSMMRSPRKQDINQFINGR